MNNKIISNLLLLINLILKLINNKIIIRIKVNKYNNHIINKMKNNKFNNLINNNQFRILVKIIINKIKNSQCRCNNFYYQKNQLIINNN